jgi:hypothetical protein
MKTKVLLFSFIVFFSFMNLAFSAELSEVFSTRYLRTDSSPNVINNSFNVMPGEGVIYIVNGAEGIHDTMVSSAEVWVNDELIFKPSDFNNNVSTLQEQIILSDVNSIRVVLNSQPGSFIWITVFAKSNDDTHSAPAYEFKDSEEPINQERAQIENKEALTAALSVQCNAPEVGSPIPYPTAVVPMSEKFYVVAGKPAAWLPPDPGEAGKTTISGIDSDSDCVRDDIERFIARLLQGSDQVTARKYMFEYAKWLGLFLTTSPLSQSDAQSITTNSYKSIQCVRKILGDTESTKSMLSQVFSQFHNTSDRSYKFIGNSSLLGGWTTRDYTDLTCN